MGPLVNPYRLLQVGALTLMAVFPPAAMADELPADAVKRIKQFDDEAEAIRKKADAEIQARKNELVKELETLAAAYAKTGKLVEEAAIRERIKDLKKPPSRILALFQQLQIGMTTKQVEAILGRPVRPPTQQPCGALEVWYIDRPERRLEARESPWGPAGIWVVYRNGILAEKAYNHQWVRQK